MPVVPRGLSRPSGEQRISNLPHEMFRWSLYRYFVTQHDKVYEGANDVVIQSVVEGSHIRVKGERDAST